MLPMGVYTIPEISAVGESEETCKEKGIEYEVGRAHYSNNARGLIAGDPAGLLKILFRRDNHKLLGVHIIGTQATELLHVGQAVLGLRAGLDYFLETVFNYPTLAECYKVAALNAANKFLA